MIASITQQQVENIVIIIPEEQEVWASDYALLQKVN